MNDHDTDTLARFARKFARIERIVPDRPPPRPVGPRRSSMLPLGATVVGALLVAVTVAGFTLLPRQGGGPTDLPPGSAPATAWPSGSPGGTATARPDHVAIVTGVPRPSGGACPAALASGRLIAHPDYGVALGHESGGVTAIRWPHGFSARREMGRVELLDQAGAVVAREGAKMGVGGGGGGEGYFGACGELSVAPAPPSFRVRTHARTVAGCGSLEGRLIADVEHGLMLEQADGQPMPVIWPDGYHAWFDDGRLALLDRAGRRVAALGDLVRVGVGGRGRAMWVCDGAVAVVPETPLDPLAAVETLSPPCVDRHVPPESAATFEEDAERSTMVFLGTVIRYGDAQWFNGRPPDRQPGVQDVLRLIRVRVDKTLVGEPGPVVTLAVPGGNIGCHGFSSANIARLDDDMYYAFFVDGDVEREGSEFVPRAWQVLSASATDVRTPAGQFVPMSEFLERVTP